MNTLNLSRKGVLEGKGPTKDLSYNQSPLQKLYVGLLLLLLVKINMDIKCTGKITMKSESNSRK